MFQTTPITWLQEFSTPPLTIFMQSLSFIGYPTFYIIFILVLFFCIDHKKGWEILHLTLFGALLTILAKEIEFDGLDEFCHHYLAKINELAIGTARIREEKKGTFKIERMAILKEYRKKGVGRAIMEEILKHYLNLNKVNNLILNSQIEAKDFYKKFGFVEVGEEFIEANIIHKKMMYNV